MSDSTVPGSAAGLPHKAADSPRWCERCQKYGDHHTDRHDECAPGSAAAPAPDPWPRYLTPVEVADMFRVDTKTVNRWAVSGRIPFRRTPGGHYRFLESDVRALLG